MCRAAQENRAHANGVSILTGTTKSRFSRIYSSIIAYLNGTKVSLHEGEATFQILTRSLKPFPRYESAKFRKNFFVFSSSFRTLCKNRHNSCVRALILLKFGTRIRGLKANTSIDFWVNLINIEGVVSDFTHKLKSNFCQVYRVNCFE